MQMRVLDIIPHHNWRAARNFRPGPFVGQVADERAIRGCDAHGLRPSRRLLGSYAHDGEQLVSGHLKQPKLSHHKRIIAPIDPGRTYRQ